jgi:adenosylhomocysteine nucleosidase
MAGLAGALDPSLNVGDVLIDDPTGIVPAAVPMRRGRIVTVNRIIATPAEKAALFERTAALAVDMETDRVRQWAARVVNVRAISDRADEVLDPRVVGLIDELGNAKPLAIAATIVRRPALIPYLNRLGKNAKLAAERLGHAVRRIIEGIDRDQSA